MPVYSAFAEPGGVPVSLPVAVSKVAQSGWFVMRNESASASASLADGLNS
jgi:hypothetical protein